MHKVEKCCECPFAIHDYEWDYVQCFMTPEEARVEVHGNMQDPDLESDQTVPPHWCPLRNGDITVTLSDVLR